MPEFGTPRRSASDDANNGIVNPPAKQAVTRQVQTTQTGGKEQGPQLDMAKVNTINNLAEALQTKVTAKKANIIEQRQTDAAIRQGNDVAMNSMDELDKRTGWKEGVFGQSATYRAAQQRMVENNVNAEYLKQSVELDEFAGSSPEEYAAILKSGLDESLKPFENDPETRKLISNAYGAKAQKLSYEHHKVHYAYVQQQNRAAESKRVQQTFDTWTVDRSRVVLQEEGESLDRQISAFFQGETKADNISDTAWAGVVNEQLKNSLRTGNIEAYRAAKKNGWLKNLSIADQIGMDEALSAYDTDFKQAVDVAYETAQLKAEKAGSFDEAMEAYEVLAVEIENLAVRSSGTERADLALTKGRVQSAKGINSVEDAIVKMDEEAARLLEIAEKEEDKAYKDRLELMYETARLAATTVETPEEAIEIWGGFHTALVQMEGKSSGRDPVETYRTQLHTKEELAKAALEEAKLKAQEQGIKADLEKDKLTKLMEAHRVENPIIRAGTIYDISPTKSENEEAFDLTLIEDVTRLSAAEEPLNGKQAAQVILGNPDIAAKIASRVGKSSVNSPLIATITNTFLNGFEGLIDPETGMLNEVGQKALDSMAQFAQNEGTFKDLIGTDNFDRYEIMSRGAEIGMTFKQINQQVEAYEAYKGNKAAYDIQWNLGKDETKTQRIKSLVNQYGGGTPTGPELAQFQEDYARALIIYQGDIRAANKYLEKTVKNASITYGNQSIRNGSQLNGVTKYSFTELMNGAQELHGEASLLTPYLHVMGFETEDKDGKPLVNLSQIEARIYTVPGTDGFFLDAPDAKVAIPISSDTMKRWETTISQRNKFKEMRLKAQKERKLKGAAVWLYM